MNTHERNLMRIALIATLIAVLAIAVLTAVTTNSAQVTRLVINSAEYSEKNQETTVYYVLSGEIPNKTKPYITVAGSKKAVPMKSGPCELVFSGELPESARAVGYVYDPATNKKSSVSSVIITRTE